MSTDPLESGLPEWVRETLREPMDSRASSRAVIMDRVRALPTPRRHSAPMRPSRWLRRGLLSPVGGMVTTAMMALVVLLRVGGGGGMSDIGTATRILGDSVVPVPAVTQADRWLDTLRIVEFVIRGSSVHAASVLGDFNRWQRGATPMVPTARHEWRVRVLVPRDALNMAYLVNNSRLIPAVLR
ncbi:MAG: hypothetical protein ABMA00_12035 [Gemmatimonas sp.]